MSFQKILRLKIFRKIANLDGRLVLIIDLIQLFGKYAVKIEARNIE